MSVFKRDGGWVIKWKDGAGRWRQQRTNSATKAEAQELEPGVARKAEFQRSGVEPMNRAVHLTFGELLDWHQEQFGRHHRSDAMRQFAEKHLRPAFGILPLVDVTAGRIDQLLTERSVDLAPKSINHLRSIVHTLFSRAIQRELWRGANPAKGVKRRKVPKRVPSFLKPEEVTLVLPQVPDPWRPMFATAIYTGMRRGELVALQRSDVDLVAGTITIGRSWKADTTKGGSAAVLPIHRDLKPFLAEALRQSPSSLVFPRADGSMQSENVDLPRLLRSALNRAGLVDGWTHKCRRCGHHEKAPTSDARHCACGFKLWPAPQARRIRFHDLRHTTATLLLKAGAPLAVVQRILRHSSPTITTEIYGHLDLDDMRDALHRLDFQPTQAPVAEVLKLAVNAPHGAPVVRNSVGNQNESPGFVDFSSETGAIEQSGRQDLNLRPLGPEPSALPG